MLRGCEEEAKNPHSTKNYIAPKLWVDDWFAMAVATMRWEPGWRAGTPRARAPSPGSKGRTDAR